MSALGGEFMSASMGPGAVADAVPPPEGRATAPWSLPDAVNRYRYFGAAKKLPGVRELFRKRAAGGGAATLLVCLCLTAGVSFLSSGARPSARSGRDSR